MTSTITSVYNGPDGLTPFPGGMLLSLLSKSLSETSSETNTDKVKQGLTRSKKIAQEGLSGTWPAALNSELVRSNRVRPSLQIVKPCHLNETYMPSQMPGISRPHLGLSSLVKACEAFPQFSHASSLDKAFPRGVGLRPLPVATEVTRWIPDPIATWNKTEHYYHPAIVNFTEK